MISPWNPSAMGLLAVFCTATGVDETLVAQAFMRPTRGRSHDFYSERPTPVQKGQNQHGLKTNAGPV